MDGKRIAAIKAGMAEAQANLEAEDAKLPERGAEDPPCWCLWCGHWRCAGPMELCRVCQAEYEERASGMPETIGR